MARRWRWPKASGASPGCAISSPRRQAQGRPSPLRQVEHRDLQEVRCGERHRDVAPALDHRANAGMAEPEPTRRQGFQQAIVSATRRLSSPRSKSSPYRKVMKSRPMSSIPTLSGIVAYVGNRYEDDASSVIGLRWVRSEGIFSVKLGLYLLLQNESCCETEC